MGALVHCLQCRTETGANMSLRVVVVVVTVVVLFYLFSVIFLVVLVVIVVVVQYLVAEILSKSPVLFFGGHRTPCR